RLRPGVLSAADVALHHVALLADLHECLELGRDLGKRGRPDPLAGALSRAGGLPAPQPAGILRADQTHCLPARTDWRPGGKTQGPGPGRRAGCRAGGQAMSAWIIANIAPIMFLGLIVFLLLGFPVAFALAALGLSFGLIGIHLGLLNEALFQALPERIFGIMSND